MRLVLPFCIALAASLSPVLSYAQHDRDRDNRGDRRDEERRAPARVVENHREQPHGFFRGERVPDQWRHRNFVVDDWRLHRLHAPPRGYQWIQVGADYLLVAIATGIISEVVGSSQVAAVPAAPPAAVGSTVPPGAPMYFCGSANAYYPYVTQCPEGWEVVSAPPPR
ncbi:MAG TPA: RcnB family protein [Burkholderiales bacterium]|nr:RcnB family protein [Burkholderiales bacterium]